MWLPVSVAWAGPAGLQQAARVGAWPQLRAARQPALEAALGQSLAGQGVRVWPCSAAAVQPASPPAGSLCQCFYDINLHSTSAGATQPAAQRWASPVTDALQASCLTGYWARSRRCSSAESSRRLSPCMQSRRWVPTACILSCLRVFFFLAARGCLCPRGCPPPPLFVLLVCILGGLCAAALRQRGTPSMH